MTTIIDRLADIDLADTTLPGGIRARVDEAYRLIHTEMEAAHTGHLADIVPLTPTTTTSRSAAA